MQWLNEPANWTESGDTITVTADAKTDFWRVTRHNFIADNGHFYYETITGDFSATVKVTGDYAALYDQAGLMVRKNNKVWIKCGIEYLDGVQQASAVVTRDFSDWSVLPLANHPRSVWFRVNRYGTAMEVSYSLDGTTFDMIRETFLTKTLKLDVGIMCAAPRGDGFETVFEHYAVTPRKKGK